MLKLSILIPVYNAEKYLQRCLDSLVPQLTDECEVILVDDGSTDASAQICDSNRSERVRVIHKSNEGALLTRRAAMMAANGEYFLFPDADDYLMPHAIDKILSTIKQYQADIICYDMYRVDKDTQRKTVIKQLPQIEVTCVKNIEIDVIRTQIALGNTAGTLNAKAIKRTVVDLSDDYSKWENRICVSNDLFQVLPCVDRAKNAVYIPEPLYCYMKNSSSITTTYKKGKIYAYYEVIKRRDTLLRKWFSDEKMVNISRARTLGSVSTLPMAAYEESIRKQDVKIYVDAIKALADFKELFLIYEEVKKVKNMVPRRTRLILDLAYRKKYRLLRLLFNTLNKRGSK